LIARGRRPQRIDVHAQRMQLQHLVVELARRPGLLSDPVEVTNILTSLLDDSRTVFVPGPLVSRNHGARLQRLDLIERGDPFASLLGVGLGEQLMNAVVCGVSGDDQSDGWHMQDGRVAGVGVPCFDRDQILSFELARRQSRLRIPIRTPPTTARP
jgi:hypothetical protein